MINYRIRKESDGYFTVYYPQKRFLGIWWDMFGWNHYYSGFVSYEGANEAVCDAIKKRRIEYLEVNCDEEKE
jgi:hypothetical protein